MFIPFDRLYHFLADVAGVDAIIYRFMPAGVKKLENLTGLNPVFFVLSWTEQNTKPIFWYHDQEPIDPSLYTIDHIPSVVAQTGQEVTYAIPPELGNDVLQEFKTDFWNRLNLRLCFTHQILSIYDKSILIHSEKNSDDVLYYENHGQIPVYYWSHALIARDWYRYAEHDPNLESNIANINTDFLIYNRAWSGTREYRLKFVEMLVQNDLLSKCNVKFNPVDDGKHYTEHVFKNPALQISSTNLHELIPANTATSEASAEIDFIDYLYTGIEVVLETIFDTTKNHLTEKALRPIAAGRPFMLVTSPGALKYLRDYGFQTFNGLINEEYDTIQDPILRLEAIIHEMKRISALSTKDKQQLYTQLYAIAKHNRDLFFSPDWGSNIVAEYKTNLDNAMILLEQSKLGSNIKHLVDHWFSRYPEFESEYHSKPHRTREEFDALLQYARTLTGGS